MPYYNKNAKARLSSESKSMNYSPVILKSSHLDSLYTKEYEQLTMEVLQQIFSSQPTQGLFNNNKVSLQKLTEAIYDSGCHISSKQFQKLFNNKKQLKIQQIYQLLKTYQLTEFDLKEQITRQLFGQDEKLSIKKLDKMMRDLGYEKELNKKDKEIMVDCFDYDRDGKIGKEDIREVIERAQSSRQQRGLKKKKSSGDKIME